MDFLFLIGIVIIFGFIGGKTSNKFKFPAVVGYIIAGVFLGPSIFGILKLDLLDRMGIISDIALGLIAFVIGNELRLGVLRKMGKTIINILFIQCTATFILISFGVYLLTRNFALSIILGALGVATAPAGTVVVLQEYRAKGPLTNTLLAVVGLDDAVTIIIFSFAIALAKFSLDGEKVNLQRLIQGPLVEIGGAIILGVILGTALSYIVRKLHNRNELLTISIGTIFICTGISNIFHLSLILSNMVLGVTVSNISLLSARRTFDAVQGITAPIYIAFFVLAGAHLQIGLFFKMGLLGLVYILIRSFSKIGGSFLGAYVSKADANIRKYLGIAMLTQAGVAIGLAMIVQREFGIYENITIMVINTIIAADVIFETIGPIGVKYAIEKSGEIGKLK